jgi:hypothetical protein
MACLVARTKRPKKPFAKACYQLIYNLPRRRDYDGLISWAKAILDGCQDAGIVVNDSEMRPMGIDRFSGKKETGGVFGVRVIIWEDE